MPTHTPARPIGAHVPVAGGLASRGLRYAGAIGAEAIQVFATNPRAWALTAGDRQQDEAFAAHLAATGVPAFIHATYLINLGSPDAVVRRRSVGSLAHSLRRGREVGARGVVVHTGSAIDGDRDKGLLRVRESLLPVLDALGDDDPDLLLEPMAGQGHMLCATVSDLGPYLGTLDWHPRLGVCLDTCHLYAAGHDLAAAGGAESLLDEAARLLAPHPGSGGGRLRLFHANDSKDSCGSRRDRHESIGAGHIGAAPFTGLLSHPATEGIPFIVETPGPRDAHAADVATLKRLRQKPGQARADPSPART